MRTAHIRHYNLIMSAFFIIALLTALAIMPDNVIPAGIAGAASPESDSKPPRAYVCDPYNNSVSVIDISTRDVIATVSVKDFPAYAAISPAGDRVYVANAGVDVISVIDTWSNEVISTVKVERSPISIAVSPDGTRVFVAYSSSNNISVIDTRTLKTEYVIRTDDECQIISISPDGKRLYAIGQDPYGNSSISIINAGEGKASIRMVVNALIQAAVVSPDNGRLYISCKKNDNTCRILALDTQSFEVVMSIEVDEPPMHMAISHDGRLMYAACYENNSVMAIDTVSGKILAVAATDGHPGSISISPEADSIYVTCQDNDGVCVIDTDRLSIVDTIATGSGPCSVAITPGDIRSPVTASRAPLAYVCDSIKGKIFVIDTNNDTVRTVINIRDGPECVSLDPAGKKAYVATGDDRIMVLDTSSGTVTGTIPLSKRIWDIRAGNGRIYGLDSANGSVLAIDVHEGKEIASVKVGERFIDIAISPDGTRIYALAGDQTPEKCMITVLNASTQTMMAQVPAGTNARDIEISPDGSHVYLLNDTAGYSSVTAINTTTYGMESTIGMYEQCFRLKISPDGSRAYLTAIGRVLVAGLEEGKVTCNVRTGQYPDRIAFNPGGTRVFVTDRVSGMISVIDTGTDTLVDTVNVEGSPDNIVIGPGETVDTPPGTGYPGSEKPVPCLLYVCNYFNDSISVIDIAAGHIVNRIKTGSGPVGIAISDDGERIYVVNERSDDVYVIDNSTMSVVTAIKVGKSPHGIALSPSGSHLYTANTFSNDVSVIDTGTNKVVDTIKVGHILPYCIAVSPGGRRVYVAGQIGDSISVINAITGRVTGEIDMGSRTTDLTFSPDGSMVYAAHGSNNTNSKVSAIDTKTNRVKANVNVSDIPSGIAISPDGSTMYVPIGDRGTITVIDAKTMTIRSTISLDSPAEAARYTLWDVAVSPDGRNIYAICGDSGKAYVIDAVSGTVIDSIDAGTNPIAIAARYIGTEASGEGGLDSKERPATRSKMKAPLVYACNYNGIAVIDTLNFTMASEIRMASIPVEVRVDRSGTRAYTVNVDASGKECVDISIIDAVTGSIIGSITPGDPVRSIAIDEHGKMVYAAGLDNLTVIDVRTGKVLSRVKLDDIMPDTVVMDMAISPDRERLYMASISRNNTGNILVADTGDLRPISVISLQALPTSIAISLDGTHAYVACYGKDGILPPGKMVIVDTVRNREVCMIDTGASPNDIAISPDGKRAYVANTGSDNVSVIDTKANVVISTIRVANPGGVEVSADGQSIYVSSALNNCISVIDTATGNVTTSINMSTGNGIWSGEMAIVNNKASAPGFDMLTVLMVLLIMLYLLKNR